MCPLVSIDGLAIHSHMGMIFQCETQILTDYFAAWLDLIRNASSPIQDPGPFYIGNKFVWLYPGHII